MEWTTILSNNLKTANQKDLFVDVSLECGLYTSTKVASSGKTDTSVADAGVQVQVLVDGSRFYTSFLVLLYRLSPVEDANCSKLYLLGSQN
jgi:hypothetical protein